MTAILLSTIAVLCVVCWVLFGKLSHLKKALKTQLEINESTINNDKQNLDWLCDEIGAIRKGFLKFEIRFLYNGVVAVFGRTEGKRPYVYPIKQFTEEDTQTNRRKADDLCALLNAK